MKFSFARTVILLRAAASLRSAVRFGAEPQSAAATIRNQPPQPPQQPNGQVIFSRSTDENGQTTTTGQPGLATPQTATAPTAERRRAPGRHLHRLRHGRAPAHRRAADRRPRAGHRAQRRQIPARPHPAANLLFAQLGAHPRRSAATWPFPWPRSTPTPTTPASCTKPPFRSPSRSRPGQSLQLDVTYSGAIAASAQRLLAIGTPDDVALHSDWDGSASPSPACAALAMWSGIRSPACPSFWATARGSSTRWASTSCASPARSFRLRLTVEFPHGHAPTVALINGHPAPLTVTESGTDQSQEVAGVATASSTARPSALRRPASLSPSARPTPPPTPPLWTLPDDEAAVQSWTAAAATVTPFLQRLAGPAPARPAHPLDLPDPEDAPFETGALLATSIRQASARTSWTAFWPTPSPTPGCSRRAPGSARAWRTSWARCGLKSSADATRPWHSRGRPHRPGAGRAGEPRPKPRPAAGPGHLARLLPHQGHLCLLDAARRGRRRHALRRPARLRSR